MYTMNTQSQKQKEEPPATSCCHAATTTTGRKVEYPFPMKKVRSVDFSRLLRAAKRGDEAHPPCASTSSSYLRHSASRRSYSEGLDAMKDSSPECGSENKVTRHHRTASGASSTVNHHHHHHTRRRSASWGVGLDAHTIPVPESFSYIPSTWTVGKVSVIFMIVAALLDFATYQVKSLESPELYDALSAEVIRPAFSYHHHHSSVTAKPKPGLGSAAISSVTEALSPILPFAGGVDLRREDYWAASNPIETLRSLTAQIQDAFASQKDSSSTTPETVAEKNTRRNASQTSGKKLVHASAISASEPFVRIDAIADLTLGEMAQTFRYVAESSKEGFREGRFLNGLSPRLQKVILAMKNVAAKSRGPSVLETSVASDVAATAGAGSFDVLKFSAAMRLFGEWRMLRNTPDGYKGFAMGMSLGHKDIVQNLVKIEHAAHSWMDRRAEMLDDDDDDDQPLRSPTLRELLDGEIEMNAHPKLPYLKEKTAAMGLLWVRRQLQYHTQLLDNAMQIPGPRFANLKDAVSAAYTQVYDRYHGWAVQKIFNYSFQSAPDETVIFRHMNPHRLQEAYQAGRKQIGSSSSSSSSSNTRGGAQHEASRSAGEQQDENPFVSFFKHVGSEWDSFAQHVGGEWDKIINNIIKKDNNNHGLTVRGGVGASSTEQQQLQDELEDFVTREMVKDAHEQIDAYLQIVYPILDELATVFQEHNMDDPTRV